MQYQEVEPPPVYHEAAPAFLEKKREALFRVDNDTLKGSYLLYVLVISALALSITIIGYVLIFMPIELEIFAKIAWGMSFFATAGFAVLLSFLSRNRQRADRLEQYGKGTNLYNSAYVGELKGNTPIRFFTLLLFLGFFSFMMGMIRYVPGMDLTMRLLLGTNGIFFVFTSFIVVYVIRNYLEGNKNRELYDEGVGERVHRD